MSRIISFSRNFPAYHDRAGHPTFFVEKIWKSLYVNGSCPDWLNKPINDYLIAMPNETMAGYYDCNPKYHTIRAGNRWKVGDKFSPRVWNGKPYNSPMIIIAPDIEVLKIWEISVKIIRTPTASQKFMTANYRCVVDGTVQPMEKLAANDGLELQDFKDWFGISKAMDKPRLKEVLFTGQIICWSDKVDYSPF